MSDSKAPGIYFGKCLQDYILFTHQQMHFLLKLEKFKCA